jgi:uroporphyrinogen-III synthase
MSDLPLEGYTVGITADRRWEEQSELLRRRGATVVHGPSIRTLPLGSERRLRAVTEELIARPPHHLVANTGIGIRAWFASADSWGLGTALLDALSCTEIHARGPKASGAVHAVGLEVSYRADSERLREVVDHLLTQPLAGKRIALQRDGGADAPDAERLRASGAEVIDLPVYEWRPPEDAKPVVRLVEGVVAGRVHAVTFTSGPALRNLFTIAGEHDLDADLRAAFAGPEVTVGCVGPVCAEAAADEGLTDVVVPSAARLGPLIRAVTDQLVSRARAIELDQQTTLSLRGTVARIGDDRIALSDIDARLLAVLAGRPGVVITKADLLREVWGDPDGDPHVVEVAIGRVRRRLGRFGSAIRSVPRRGYLLDVAG